MLWGLLKASKRPSLHNLTGEEQVMTRFDNVWYSYHLVVLQSDRDVSIEYPDISRHFEIPLSYKTDLVRSPG